MCSLWIVNYKHKFIIAINFFYYWPFLYLFWIKYQLCYSKRCLYTQKFYLFIGTISCSFSVFVENCILLPKGLNEFVVFLCIVHVWFWFFILLPRFFIVSHIFQVQECSIKIFLSEWNTPFSPNANAKKWNVIHVYIHR
jgi:hypothetical protein